jgi:hypothetical protein
MNPEAGHSELKSVEGMTLRAWLAGISLQGLLSNPVYAQEPFKMNGVEMALDVAALQLADSVLRILRFK